MPDFVPLGAELITLLFFLLPGFVFLWSFERMAGPVWGRGTERLVRAVAWSTTIYAAGSPWLVRLGTQVAEHRTVSSVELWAAGVVFVFVAPLALGITLGLARTSGLAEGLRERLRRVSPVDPTPTAWDYALQQETRFFVRIRLKNGERVGGYYGERSYASSYPEPHEIFLESAWRLDDDGTFIEPIEGSRGLLVSQSEVEVLELMDAGTKERTR